MTEYSHEDYVRFVEKYGSVRKASEAMGKLDNRATAAVRRAKKNAPNK